MEEVEHRSSLHDHCECDVRKRIWTTFVDDLGTNSSLEYHFFIRISIRLILLHWPLSIIHNVKFIAFILQVSSHHVVKTSYTS